MLSERRCRGGRHTLAARGHRGFERNDQERFCSNNVCFMLFCFCFLILHLVRAVTAHKQDSRFISTWKPHFQLINPHHCRLIQSGKMKGAHKNLCWCCTDLLILSVRLPLSISLCLSLVQIQDFSSGFWDGSKLACWMKGETPWRFFPKLSIYLRATNTSQSFRITILPQVPGYT